MLMTKDNPMEFQSGPRLLRYDLSADVLAFSTMRQGGVSQGAYASFNINRYCGDCPSAVQANRASLCQLLHVGQRQLIYPHQTHGTAVAVVDDTFLSFDDDARAAALDGIDALVTDRPGICIGVSTADCIPILLYDPRRRVVGAVHAGWRGTVARIVSQTVDVLHRAYGTNAADLRAVIGPGISREHFEVGDEVYQAFSDAGFHMPSIATRTDKWHLDLPACNRQQLIDSGLLPDNVHLSAVCTYDRVGDFFSARRLGIGSGRIFSGILLR